MAGARSVLLILMLGLAPAARAFEPGLLKGYPLAPLAGLVSAEADSHVKTQGSLYLGPALMLKDHYTFDVPYVRGDLNSRGYGIGLGNLIYAELAGVNLSAGMFKANRELRREDRKTYFSTRASFMFTAVEFGIGFLAAPKIVYGEIFLGVVLPFWPFVYARH